jgi:hypothetical protein
MDCILGCARPRLPDHDETITAAIAGGRRQIRSLGKFPNRPEAVRKLIEKLGGGSGRWISTRPSMTDRSPE